MATWLKQSTAVDVKVGPFLDETDGKTAETALTITQPDIMLGKNGGAFAQKNAAQTLTHESNGWYEVALDTTDTNTLGILILQIHESGALPVWREFMVVPANVYDGMISGTGVGPRSDVQGWLGTAPNALVSGRVDVQTGAMAAGVVTAAAIATGAIDADALAADAVDEIWAKAMSDIAAVPGMTASVLSGLNWLFALSRNTVTQTATTQIVTRDDGTTALGTSTVSDDGTTATRGEFV